MERQSTSKLFRILIAIAAFFILCSSSLLFAACDSTIGVKDHEHVLGETAIAETEPSCTVPGTVTYKCTDEECSYVKTVVTGLPTGHDFDENGVCRVCKLTKSEAGDLDDTLQSTQKIQETLNGITKTLEEVAKSTDLQTKLATDTFNSTLQSKLTDLQTKLIADLLSDADFGTAMSALQTTLQGNITDAVAAVVAQVYQPLLEKYNDLDDDLASALSSLKTLLVGQGLADGETDLASALKKAITSGNSEIMTKLGEIETSLKAAIEANGDKIDDVETNLKAELTTKFNDLNTSLPTTLKEKVVDVLETYLSGDGFLGKIMGETGFKGLQKQIEGYLGEESEVVTQLGDISTYLEETIKAELDNIKKTLGDATSGLVKSVADLAAQLTTATSGITSAIEGLVIPKVDDIATAVDGKIKAYFASSEYTKVIQGLLDNTFSSDNLNSLLGVTEKTLVEELNKKFEGVTGAIGDLKTLLTEGTTGKQIAALETMIKKVYEELFGSAYVEAGPAGAPSAEGPSIGEAEKPVGMLSQVDDLWDKTKGLLDNLAALQGENNEATLSAILAAVRGIEIPEGKDYTENFTNLTNTLNTLKTNYGTINETLGKLQGNYNTLATNYTTLTNTVAGLQTELGKVNTTLGELKSQLNWVLSRSEKFEKLMQVLEGLWTEYGSYVSNEKLQAGLKQVLDFAVNNVDKLDRLNDIADTLAWFVNNKTKFESYVSSLDKYIEDIEKIYDAFHTALPDESLDSVLGQLQTFLKKALDNNYFEEAINAAKGLKNFLGTTEESGKPTTTLADIVGYFKNITDALDALKNPNYDSGNANHVHSWVEVLMVKQEDGSYREALETEKPNCIEENVYTYECAICGTTQTDKDGKTVTRTVPATGHVMDYKKGLGENDEGLDGHYHAPTCVNPGYVQGYCVNCGEWLDWTTVGQPTYKHHYVLETGVGPNGELEGDSVAAHQCGTYVHDNVYHCETCGSAYVVKTTSSEGGFDPSDVHGNTTTPHNYYTHINEKGEPKGDPLTAAEQQEIIKEWAEANDKQVDELTQQEKYNALKPYLNIVNHGSRTCIDPELAVVECTVCKMRYAYSYGDPLGHTLVLQTAADATPTCTTDGVLPYYYCETCGYYFYFDTNENNWQAKESPVETSKVVDETTGKTADKYRFWNQYLSDDDGVIKGEPTGEKGALTEAGQRAYDWAAVKAYGHKFSTVVHTIEGACGWATRTFKICDVCGNLDVETASEVTEVTEGKLFKDTYKLSQLGDDGAYTVTGPFTFGKEVGYTWDPTKYTEKNDGTYYSGEPNFITNLKARGKEAAAAKLVELGYAEAIDAAKYETVDALIAAFVTGWNVTPYTPGEIKPHSFVPVYVGRVDCITAQDYILVCKDCYEANGMKFAELFDEVKDGDDACHYTVKSTATDLLTEGKADAAKILENATVAPVDDATHYESDLSLSWKALVGANTTTDAVLGWLEKYGFLVFDKEDDMNLEKFKALYAGKEWTEVEAELVKYYGEGKNVIDTGLELPVQGHSFKEGVITVVGNCVMYQRTVWYCEVCCDKSSQLNPEDPKTGPAPFNVTIKLDPLRQGTWQNDLVASWAAARNAEDATVDSVLLWLANHGYLNAEREFLGYEIYVEGAFQTVEAGSAELTALKKFIADVEFKVQPESLQLYQLDAFFTWGNTTKEFTAGNHVHAKESAAGEYKSQNVIGHHFNAILVDSASCEEGGYYVYVCTECGMEDVPTGKFSYTIDGTRYETEILEATDFTLKADSDAELTDASDDQSLFDDAVHADRRATFNGGKTDLALLVEAAIADDDTTSNGTAVMTLAVLGYFDTIGDTMAGVGKAGYDKSVEYRVSDHWSEFVQKIADVIADEKIPDVTKLSDFFTQTNQTLADIGTIVPVMNHLMKDGKGNAITKDTPLCTDFQDEQLTAWFKEGYYAVWTKDDENPDGHWTKSTDKFDTTMFDASKYPLNHAWYEAAQKYGIIGACSRDNCPQHTNVYTGIYKGEDGEEAKVDGKFTAGYVAATDHEMHYYKFVEEAGGKLGTVPTKAVDMSVAYNRYSEDEYPMTVNDVMYNTRDDDPTNLDTLQRIYNAIHPADENKDNRYPENGSLWAEYGKGGAKEVKWQPITRGSKPSCWVDLRCKWYHYGDTENPYKGTAEPNPYDGTKCNERGEVNQHTLPLRDTDPDYLLFEANCQHGRYCRICGDIIGSTGKHNFISVDEIMAVDEEGNPLHKEYYDAYHEAYEDLCKQLKELNPDKVLEDPALWAFQLEATCQQEGRKVEICVGELELYKAKNDRWNELFTKKGWVENTNYKITTVEPIEHAYTRHEWHVTYLDKQGYTQVQICKTLEEFEAFYNPCTMSYYIVDYCTKTLRNAEGKVVKGNTVCGTASGDYTPALGVGIRMQQRPTSAQWNSGDSWKQWYTAKQLEILGGVKPSMRPATVPKYGTSDVAGYDGSFGSTVPWTDELGHYEVTPAQGHYYAPIEDYQNSRYYEAATKEHSALVPLVCVICGQQVISYYGEGEQYHWATDAQINAWNDAGNEPKAEPIHGIDDKNSVKADAVDDLWLDGDPEAQGLFGIGTTTLTENVTVDKGLMTTTVTENPKFPDDYTDSKWLAVAGNTVIDLNGKKLTLNGIKGFEALNPSPDLKLTFRNGTLDLGDLQTLALIEPTKDAYLGKPVEFDNVTVECGTSNSTIMPINGGTLIFRNSVIKGGSYPPVSTNGSLTNKYSGSMNCNIILENSTVIGDTIGLLFNNASANLTAKGCTFYGGQIGAVVRGGTATFEDCTFYCGTTAASSSGTWSDGTQIHAHAALVLGNNGGDYGDTTATLKGCTFGSATLGEDGVTLTATKTTDSAEKLAVYALDNHETNVTLDKATANACVDSLKQHGDEDHIHLLIDLQKDTVSSAEAAALILGAATSGGAVNLPAVEGGITLGSKDEPAVLDVTKDLELVLAGTLNVTGGIKVEDGATLRIEGGAVNAGVNGTSQAIVVKNGGALNLDTVTLTVTEAQVSGDLPMSTYGVYAMENSTVTIADSKIYNAHGPALGTNNNHAPVKLVLIDSAFISDVEEGEVDASTSVGLLINNDEHSVFAGGCLFYGTNAAVWVRSGKAVFAGCTFATEGVERSYNTKWGTGAGFHQDATAAIIVGNGANTAYGSAEVEIDDCTVVFKDIAALDDVKAIVPTALSIKREEYEADWTVNGTEAATGKAITFAAVSTCTTTVNFSDIDTAKAFLGKNLDLTVGGETPNVFLYEDAKASQVKVGYYTYKSEEEGGERIELPVPINVKQILAETEVKEKAPEALKDAAANGGIVDIPKVEEPITVDEQLAVAAEKSVEIDLNGNTLALADETKNTYVQGKLTISGGTVTVPEINKNSEGQTPAGIAVSGKGAQLTLEDATVISESSILPANGATLVIRNSFIRSNNSMAISTNNLEVDPDATIEIYDSTIASMDQSDGTHEGNGGNVGLLINNPRVKLTAEKSTFYGVCTGAWVRGGEATFTECTFISGSAIIGSGWGSGTKSVQEAKAALLVGNGGAAESYGSATVTLTKCTCIVSKEVVKKGDDGKYVACEGNKVTVDDTQAANAKIKAEAVTVEDVEDGKVAKTLVLAAYKDSITTITLDDASAKSFGVDGEGAFVKDTNVLYGDATVTKASFVITVAGNVTDITEA